MLPTALRPVARRRYNGGASKWSRFLPMDTHDGLNIAPSPKTVIKRGETPHPVELPRGVSDVAVE